MNLSVPPCFIFSFHSNCNAENFLSREGRKQSALKMAKSNLGGKGEFRKGWLRKLCCCKRLEKGSKDAGESSSGVGSSLFLGTTSSYFKRLEMESDGQVPTVEGLLKFDRDMIEEDRWMCLAADENCNSSPRGGPHSNPAPNDRGVIIEHFTRNFFFCQSNFMHNCANRHFANWIAPC